MAAATTKVRVLVSVSGTRDGEPWPPVGQVWALPADEAEQYAAAGLVEPVDAKRKSRKNTDGDALGGVA